MKFCVSFIFLSLFIFFVFIPYIFPLSEGEKLGQLTSRAQKVFTEFLRQARVQFPEHRIVVAETYRTQAKQNELFKKGKHITTVKVSMHTKRLAADIYFMRDGKILAYEKAPYPRLGKLGESLGLRWGGRWKVPFDPGHYEFIN